jgi:hypothetical protein
MEVVNEGDFDKRLVSAREDTPRIEDLGRRSVQCIEAAAWSVNLDTQVAQEAA